MQVFVAEKKLFEVITEKGEILLRVFHIKDNRELESIKLIGFSLKEADNGGFQNTYSGDISELHSLIDTVLTLFCRRNFYEMSNNQRVETIREILTAQLNHQGKGLNLSLKFHEKTKANSINNKLA